MALTEDFTVFLNTGEFADPAVITTSVGPLSITGIFDSVYNPVLAGDGSGRSITLACVTAQLVGVRVNNPVVVKGKTYQITDIQPIQDGQWTELHLKEA